MEIFRLILMPVTGGIIGYFTNWLAIKMLFRPYKEKRLFGIKLPFTPGLIPKERHTLAKKTGETVSANVLTEEVLRESILSDDIRGKIEKAIDDLILNLKQNENSIYYSLEKMMEQNKLSSVINSIEGYIKNFADKLCDNDQLKAKISTFLKEKAIDILKNPERILEKEDMARYINNFIDTELLTKLDDEETVEKIKSSLSKLYYDFINNDVELSNYASEKTVEKIKQFVRVNISKAIGFIIELPEKYESVDENLKMIFKKIAEDNLNSFISIFLNFDKIYVSGKKRIFEYISDEDNQQKLADEICNKIDSLTGKDIKFLLEAAPRNIDADINNILFKIKNYLSDDERRDKIFDFTQNKIDDLYEKGLYDGIENKIPDIDEKLKTFFYKLTDRIFAEAVNKFKEALPSLIDRFFNMSVKDLFSRFINNENEEKAKKLAFDTVVFGVEKGGGYIIKNLDLGKIIEEKINEFEMAEAEKMIMDVVHKELDMITILGGILGFIIGLASLALNFL